MPDIYRFHWIEEGIEAQVFQPVSARNGVLCELRISTSRPPTPGLLHPQAKCNLSSLPTLKQWQRALEEREPDIEWTAIMAQISEATSVHLRDGEPLIDLRELEPTQGHRQLIPDVVEDVGHTNLHADGGSGKTTTATALAVSVASGQDIGFGTPERSCPVLILDWETSADVSGDMFRAICAGADIDHRDVPVHYMHMSVGLIDAAATVRRRIGEVGAGFVIADSMGYARNGDPESAELTIRLFNALRSFRVPTLGVDHITKNGGKDNSKAFGSVYTHNASRRTWGLVKTSDEGSSRLTVAMTNYKANNGRLARRRGYHIDYTEDDFGRPLTIQFTPCDVRDIPSFAGKLSQKDQLIAVLKGGALTDAEAIAALSVMDVSMNDATIRALVSRYKDTFTRIYDDDRRSAPKIGLLFKAMTNG